jgi:hypothetical protein
VLTGEGDRGGDVALVGDPRDRQRPAVDHSVEARPQRVVIVIGANDDASGERRAQLVEILLCRADVNGRLGPLHFGDRCAGELWPPADQSGATPKAPGCR